jgi:hypothetical protein
MPLAFGKRPRASAQKKQKGKPGRPFVGAHGGGPRALSNLQKQVAARTAPGVAAVHGRNARELAGF